MIDDNTMARFWDKVDKGNPDECWEWTSAKTPYGYGVLRVDGKNLYAHRMSLEAEWFKAAA